MTVETILSKLEKVKKTGFNRWIARCPCHTDKTPSLAVRDDNGTVLIHCFGCGAAGPGVCEAIGEDVSELFPPSDYSGFNSKDYEHAAKKRSIFPADQVLEALQTETIVLLMITKDITETGTLTEEVRDRLLQSIYRINAVHREYQR